MAGKPLNRIFIGLLFFSFFLVEPTTVGADNLSSWRFPLPAGDYTISQGDKGTIQCDKFPPDKKPSHCEGELNIFALDIRKSDIKGTAILAPAPGRVIKNGKDGKGGYYVAPSPGLT